MTKTIFHLDMNSYFAAVEQQANPFLRNRPIGIVKSEGRTCVIAASKEAKKYGVKTGCSTFEAMKLCPRIVLVPSDMDKYFSVTKQLINLISEFTPTVEVFSIDEMFMDVTEVQKLYPGGSFEIAVSIKERIKKDIGEWLTCSIGISYNKILAKLAGEQMKPDGLYIIDENNLDQVFANASLDDVCGIGSRIKRRLVGIGISNLLGIRRIPRTVLIQEFGDHWTNFLINTAHGIGDDQVVSCTKLPDQKSVSRTFTLFHNTSDIYEIRSVVRNLCEEVGWKLREMDMKARCFGLSLRGDNFGGFERLTVKKFVDDGREIFDLVNILYRRIEWKNYIRFVGIWATNLSPRSSVTLSIFPDEQKKDRRNMAMDSVNNKLGYFSVMPGNMVGLPPVRPEPNGYLGDKKFLLSH